MEILLGQSFAGPLVAVLRSGAGGLEGELEQVERLEQLELAGTLELIGEQLQAGKPELVVELEREFQSRMK